MDNDFLNKIENESSKQIDKYKEMPKKLESSTKNIGTKITEFLTGLLKSPSEKKDYIRIGKIYIAKKFVLIFSLVVVIVIYLLTAFFFPWANGNLWPASVKINSSKFSSFSGKKVNVKDQAGVTIYKGEMISGAITGKGTQYGPDGTLVYEGEFLNGSYSGQGKLYNSLGNIIYKGGFLQNLYDGEGELYDDFGKIQYKGMFESGQRSGTGIEYSLDTGNEIYYGEFLNDLRDGKGTELFEDGQKKYEGDFSSGEYGGIGKLYWNNVLKYFGGFANGSFDGEGTLFEENTGEKLFKGSFASGVYDGYGTLFDPKTSKVLYQGKFEGGKRAGEGTSFDKLGAVSFSGKFKDDNINYLDYLGAKLDDVKKEFGKENYREVTNDSRLILTYLGVNTSIVFTSDEDSGDYICEKILLGNKDTFMGLKSDSTKNDIINVLGTPYSSVDYNFAKYYDTIFKQLSVDLKSGEKAPSDKFLMDQYYIRIYYDKDKSKYLSVEIAI